MKFNPFMLTITSYFGFLLAALTITPALFIGLNKDTSYLKWIEWIEESFFWIHGILLFHTNYQYFSWLLRFMDSLDYYWEIDVPIFLSPRTNRNDWHFSIWSRLRPNAYYFSGIICDCVLAIQAWGSVGSLIEYKNTSVVKNLFM
jgi:hypothetical protein